MQIILLEKVLNLGNLGEVVKVKDGYARNFLIPQKKAKRATPAALAEFEARRAELEKLAAEKLAAAQAVADKLNGAAVSVLPASRQWMAVCFGFLWAMRISPRHSRPPVFDVDKSAVRLPEGPLKMIGEFPVEVALHTDVLATVTVNVVAE